ncbi:MAG: Rieske 2Fe-2S domain-containing protein [Novosphingobium sp.]
MTPNENERLTRVTGEAPMGRLMRENYWLPFARCEALEPGGAPMKVRLLGSDLVAFRGKDGTLGLVDERCPHRLASLALARVEDCSLRCIYHGWRIDHTGKVAEVPSEGERSAQFAARIRTKRYHVAEGGGWSGPISARGSRRGCRRCRSWTFPPKAGGGAAWWFGATGSRASRARSIRCISTGCTRAGRNPGTTA